MLYNNLKHEMAILRLLYNQRTNSFKRYLSSLAAASIFILSGCQSASKPPLTSELSAQATAIDSGAVLSENQAKNYQLALNALNDKNYSQAESLLTNLTKKRPDLAGPWANLGLLNLVQQRLDKAKEYLSTALVLNPKMPEALNLMGLLSVHNRDIQSALDHYESAVAAKSTYANAHYNLALLYDIYLQDLANAAKHYRLYLQNIKYEDKETLSWVEQLESSLK